MSFLDTVKTSKDVKKLNIKDLPKLCEEIRQKIIEVAKTNGGHLSSNLGIVETTVAVHYVFDLPSDKLVFDVGHQCYTHKLLSGRKDKFSTIRQYGGISGFPDKDESEYDMFTTGHAGSSVSQCLGLCSARDIKKEKYNVIDIVGDGSFVNGLNLEAVTSSVTKPKNFLVILNDNGMSISRNENGLYKFISKGTIKPGYIRSKNIVKKILGNSFIAKGLLKIKEFIKRVIGKNSYFERYGFKYVGIINGNNVIDMVKVLSRIKGSLSNKAVVLYIRTKKGKGLEQAEEHSDLYHGVGANLDLCGGVYASSLGKTLNRLIDKDGKIVAITAGMKDGTGLAAVEKAHKNNFYDVGIAEEYAVTFASGLACNGLKPVVAIYSTFLQRSYDQILHDVCLQNLPVVFCLDRAGLVGADGKTHQGAFDLSFLSHLPNMTIFAPTCIKEFEQMIEYALTMSSPVAIRYPNDRVDNDREFLPVKDCSFEKIADGKDVSILAVGPRMLKIAEEVRAKSNKSVGIINARCIKPLDEKTLDEIKDTFVITLEENSVIGGFGALVNGYYIESGAPFNIKNYGIKDEFVCHGDVKIQLKENGLTAENILADIDK